MYPNMGYYPPPPPPRSLRQWDTLTLSQDLTLAPELIRSSARSSYWFTMASCRRHAANSMHTRTHTLTKLNSLVLTPWRTKTELPQLRKPHSKYSTLQTICRYTHRMKTSQFSSTEMICIPSFTPRIVGSILMLCQWVAILKGHRRRASWAQ